MIASLVDDLSSDIEEKKAPAEAGAFLLKLEGNFSFWQASNWVTFFVAAFGFELVNSFVALKNVLFQSNFGTTFQTSVQRHGCFSVKNFIY